MSKLEDTVRIIAGVHKNVTSIPDELEIDRLNGVALMQMLSVMCDIAVSLAIIADNMMPNLEEEEPE